MKRLLPILVGCSILALGACSSSIAPGTQEDGAAASIESDVTSSQPIRETQNVSYQGIVEAAGVGIYMQGSHQLRLSDGRFILLESKDINLDNYLGKKVGVFGATRPTVEGNAIIMRVEEVLLMEEAASSQSSASIESVSSASLSSEDASVSSAPLSSVASSRASSAAMNRSSTIAMSSTAQSSVAPPSSGDAVPAGMQARADIMAKDNLTGGNWTQRYCTSHIGFCFPVHRNWWFKSFGTTTSSLWHVEVSNGEILNLGEGPIVVKLLSGSVGSKKATDGQVRVQGNWVIGFKSWGDSEHFEITAPANLRGAVEYITEHLTASEGQ